MTKNYPVTGGVPCGKEIIVKHVGPIKIALQQEGVRGNNPIFRIVAERESPKEWGGDTQLLEGSDLALQIMAYQELVIAYNIVSKTANNLTQRLKKT